MNLLKVLLVAIFFLSNSVFSSDQFTTDSHSIILDFVKTKILNENLPPKQVLIVFDLDNTLIASNSELGSDQWFSWQYSLLDKSASKIGINNFNDLLSLQGELFAVGRMHLTQQEIPNILTSYEKLGVNTMALTSRNPNFRNSTQRELSRLRIDFINSPGKSIGQSFIPHEQKRFASYQNGIFMTAGMHKGEMLRYLLGRFRLKYKAIIFIDDHEKHTKRVFEEFKSSPTSIYTYRYSREDKRVEDFINKDKTQLNKLAKDFIKLSKKIKQLSEF